MNDKGKYSISPGGPTPGTTVRVFRAAHRWSQGRLAEEAGLTVPTISRIENGIGQMNMTTARKLCATLGCELEDLLPPVYPGCPDERGHDG